MRLSHRDTAAMAGAVEGVATNVPVKDNSNEAQAATAYGDNTFARENVTLLNGNNTFTAVAEDNYVPSANYCSFAFFAASRELQPNGSLRRAVCLASTERSARPVPSKAQRVIKALCC